MKMGLMANKLAEQRARRQSHKVRARESNGACEDIERSVVQSISQGEINLSRRERGDIEDKSSIRYKYNEHLVGAGAKTPSKLAAKMTVSRPQQVAVEREAVIDDIMEPAELERVEKALKRYFMLSDIAQSKLIRENDLLVLATQIDSIPDSAQNPQLVEDPMYDALKNSSSVTKYRPRKKDAYYLSKLHYDLVSYRREGWSYATIEKHLKKQRRMPYKFTATQLRRLFLKHSSH